jgi:hypothetical protein
MVFPRLVLEKLKCRSFSVIKSKNLKKWRFDVNANRKIRTHANLAVYLLHKLRG